MAEIIVDGRIPTHGEWRDAYDAQMAEAEATYRDVLELLWSNEIPAFITQTGGMCLAIQIPGPRDSWFWLTDAEDALSWEREPDQGWGLGYYDADGEMMWPDLITCGYKTARTALAMVREGLHRIQREGAP